MTKGAGLFRILGARLRPQPVDITVAASWGVAAATTTLWLVQPFDWLKQKLFEKAETEK